MILCGLPEKMNHVVKWGCVKMQPYFLFFYNIYSCLLCKQIEKRYIRSLAFLKKICYNICVKMYSRKERGYAENCR